MSRRIGRITPNTFCRCSTTIRSSKIPLVTTRRAPHTGRRPSSKAADSSSPTTYGISFSGDGETFAQFTGGDAMNDEKITVRVTETGQTMDVVVFSKQAASIQVVLGQGVHSVKCDLKPTRTGLAYVGS